MARKIFEARSRCSDFVILLHILSGSDIDSKGPIEQRWVPSGPLEPLCAQN
jgi:hypothetical protein